MFQELAQLLSEIEGFLKEKSSKDAYDAVLEWCTVNPTEQVEGTWLHDMILGSCLLTNEAASKLVPKGKPERDTQGGHHVVKVLNGMHIKYLRDVTGSNLEIQKPVAKPGLEFMVDRLVKIVFGNGTAPARLLKLTKGNRQICVQAAKSVRAGEGLDHVIK